MGKAWKLAGYDYFQSKEKLESKFIEDAKADLAKKKSSRANSSDEGNKQVACYMVFENFAIIDMSLAYSKSNKLY